MLYVARAVALTLSGKFALEFELSCTHSCCTRLTFVCHQIMIKVWGCSITCPQARFEFFMLQFSVITSVTFRAVLELFMNFWKGFSIFFVRTCSHLHLKSLWIFVQNGTILTGSCRSQSLHPCTRFKLNTECLIMIFIISIAASGDLYDSHVLRAVLSLDVTFCQAWHTAALRGRNTSSWQYCFMEQSEQKF